MKPASSASGARNGVKPSRRTCPATSSSSSALVTEALNRHWYERNTGQIVECVQHRLRHPVLRWMGATVDGIVAGSGTVFEAKFMLPWSFSEEAAAEKHMAQFQHNMWVTNARGAALSIITGGGKWVEIQISADPALPASPFDRGKEILALRGEWRVPFPVRRRAASAPHRGHPHCGHEFVQFLGGVRGPVPQYARRLSRSRAGKEELKILIPEDAKEAIGHGVRAKRSKSGAVSFDALDTEAARASIQ